MARLVKKAFRWPGALAVVALYGASFFAPAWGFFPKPMPGWEAFWEVTQSLGNVLTGNIKRGVARPDELALGVCQYLAAWLPNPLVVVGVGALLAGRRHLPWILGAIAVLCALITWASWPLGIFLIGFYLWAASMGLLAAIGIWRVWRQYSRSGLVSSPAVLTHEGTFCLPDPPRQDVRVSTPGPGTSGGSPCQTRTDVSGRAGPG